MPRFRSRRGRAGARRSGTARGRGSWPAARAARAGQQAGRRDGLLAVVADLEAVEPGGPLAVQDAVDADLVMGTPSGGAHSNSSQRPVVVFPSPEHAMNGRRAWASPEGGHARWNLRRWPAGTKVSSGRPAAGPGSGGSRSRTGARAGPGLRPGWVRQDCPAGRLGPARHGARLRTGGTFVPEPRRGRFHLVGPPSGDALSDAC